MFLHDARLPRGATSLTSGSAVEDDDEGDHDEDEADEQEHDAADRAIERVHDVPARQRAAQRRDVRASTGRNNDARGAAGHDECALRACRSHLECRLCIVTFCDRAETCSMLM